MIQLRMLTNHVQIIKLESNVTHKTSNSKSPCINVPTIKYVRYLHTLLRHGNLIPVHFSDIKHNFMFSLFLLPTPV